MAINMLKKRSEFVRVSVSNFVYKTQNLVIQCLFDTSDLRFGLTVSKRVGNAVKRNKIKRRFRAILEDVQKNIETKSHIVLIAKPHIINSDFLTIKNNIYDGIKFCIDKYKRCHIKNNI